jgi:hypothetical protein
VATKVQLSVFDLLGQELVELVNERQVAGFHQVIWNADNFSSGVYIYRIQAGEFTYQGKMVLVK